MIEADHPRLSIQRQCALVSISRSAFYYQPAGEPPLNLELMRLIDETFLETPWYGSRQMARHLRRRGYGVGRMRVRRLMAKMGLAPIYQKPRTTIPHPEHRAQPGRLCRQNRGHQRGRGLARKPARAGLCRPAPAVRLLPEPLRHDADVGHLAWPDAQ